MAACEARLILLQLDVPPPKKAKPRPLHIRHLVWATLKVEHVMLTKTFKTPFVVEKMQKPTVAMENVFFLTFRCLRDSSIPLAGLVFGPKTFLWRRSNHPNFHIWLLQRAFEHHAMPLQPSW